MEKINLTFDATKILSKILETDSNLHDTLRRRIEETLVSNISHQIESEFFGEKWDGRKEIYDRVLEDLKEKQTELVKSVLKEFYESYRYNKKDLAILKKLKKFIDEN